MQFFFILPKNFFLILILLGFGSVFCTQNVLAQTPKIKIRQEPLSKKTENIVPNPGFERFSSAPIGWFYKGLHFSQVMKYWYSATTASPDIYGPQVKVPIDWAEKGFGKQTAHTGKNMVGLTLYGCVNGKPHCREYIQIQLAEPLVKGQWYYAEFWTTHLEKSMQVNNLGLFFSKTKIDRKTDEQLLSIPQVNAPKPVKAANGKWVKVSGKFKANEAAEYLCIGNFYEDKGTTAQYGIENSYNYAYYYFDDILVKRIPPYLFVPTPPDDLSKIALKLGDTVQLKNIFFEFDKDELMPRSSVELDKLSKILHKYPKMKIEIIGHTDNEGEDAYNLELSKRRANAVVNYLIEYKINTKRLTYRGEGEKSPIDSNNSDEGRANNRRVEFVILSK
jgi:OmpA-OmpF porin, OOP family